LAKHNAPKEESVRASSISLLHRTAADPRLWFAGRVIMALQNATNFGSDATLDTGAAQPSELRSLASCYRSFAEKAGNPAIRERRLLTAEQLEEEAARLEETLRREQQGKQR
jgi:hypothetical protein